METTKIHKFIEYFINVLSNQGVKERRKMIKTVKQSCSVLSFCVIKSSKDQQEEANKLFIALPEMYFFFL